MGENASERTNNFEAIATSSNNAEQVKRIAAYLGISEEMMSMINRAAEGFLMQEGVPKDKMPQKREEEKCFR